MRSACVAAALRAERRAIRLCWEREAIKNPKLEGKLWFGFDITTDGTVDALQVTEDTVGNATVAACIGAIIEQVTVPKPAERVPVIYPVYVESNQ